MESTKDISVSPTSRYISKNDLDMAKPEDCVGPQLVRSVRMKEKASRYWQPQYRSLELTVRLQKSDPMVH